MISILSLVGTLLCVAPPNASANAPSDSVLEVYDLRPLTPDFDSGDGWEQSLQLPPSGRHDRSDIVLGELYDQASPEVVVDLIGQLFGDELRYEGREIRLVGGDSLLVLAPREIHARVRSVLAVLEEIVTASIGISVEILTLPESVESPAGGMIDIAEAERILVALQGQGAEHQSYEMRAIAGRTAGLDQTNQVSYLRDYDVEIAQGSSILDPILEEIEEGTRLFLRAVPARDGVFLSVILLQAEIVGGMELVEVRARGTIWTEQGESLLEGPLEVQAPRVASASLAFDTFLAAGKAAVLTTELDIGEQQRRQVIILRRTGGAQSSFHNREILGSTRRFLAVNSELLSPPRMEFIGPYDGDRHERDPLLEAMLSTEPSLFLFDWMKHRFSVWRRLGPWALVVTDPAWDDDAADQLQALIAGWSPATEVTNVEARLHYRSEGSTIPVRWNLPVRDGSACAVRIGLTRVALVDYYVEVAQRAAIDDPVFASIFEGLSMGITAARGGTGSLTMQVQGIADIATGASRSILAGNKRMGPIELPALAHLDVHESLNLAGGAQEALHLRLGDSGQGARASLQLEIVVR